MGSWLDCKECLDNYPMEMSVWYGTNKYNFEKLKNPPSFEPTLCSVCQKRIILPDGGYTKFDPEHWHDACSEERDRRLSGPRVVGNKTND
jgi:hypothetical protein